MDQKKIILVTGADGLLGRRLVDDLAQDCIVHAISRRDHHSTNPNINYLKLDLSESWAVDQLPVDVYGVIHLAQSDKFKDFPDFAMDVFNVNLQSTSKLLDFAYQSGVKKFILASTGGIYRRDKVPLNCDSDLEAPSQLSHYFGTKLAAEIFANNYKEIFDVDILRLFFMYGPGQKQHMFIPRLIEAIKKGLPITLAGNDGIKVNPIYVNDVSKIVHNRILIQGSEVLNVCGSEIVSIRDIAEAIGEQLGKKPIFQQVEGADDLIAHSSRTSELLENEFTNLVSGLQAMINDPHQ